MKRLTRFVFAGGVGFLADAAVLAFLLAFTPLGPFFARILSICFALTVTWMLNRRLTFAPSGRGVVREGARYGGVGLSTSLINFLVYSALLYLMPTTPPLAALAVASLAATALSFMGYSRFVFDR